MTTVDIPSDTEAPAGSAPTGPDDTAWRRLSPRMLLVHPVIELLRALPALAGIFYLSHGGPGQLWSEIGLVLVVLYGVIRWLTTSYRVSAEHVQVRRGVIGRSILSVPRDRVRTVDLTAPLIHRALGLSKITIGTGTSDRKDGGLKLDALAAEEAVRLRGELLHRPSADPAGATTGPAVAAAVSPERIIARFRPAWLVYGPFSLSGLLPVVIAVGAGMQFVAEAKLTPEKSGFLRAISDQLSHASPAVAVTEVLVACLLVVAIASTIGYLFRFWNFTLSRPDGQVLHVSRGLLTTRSTTIEERRLRGVEISEPLVLRFAQGARCIAITTGLRVGHGADRGGSLLLPPSPHEEVERVAAEILEDPKPVTAPLVEHGPAAQRRRYTRVVVPAVLLTGALYLMSRYTGWPGWVWQLSIPLIPLGAMLAKDRYRNLGHVLLGRRLVMQRGALTRRRSMLDCDGIIGWRVYQSLFQRRFNVVTVTATTAAGKQEYSIQDLARPDAVALMDRAVPGLLTPFLAK
jgi:putative membrane protein